MISRPFWQKIKDGKPKRNATGKYNSEKRNFEIIMEKRLFNLLLTFCRKMLWLFPRRDVSHKENGKYSIRHCSILEQALLWIFGTKYLESGEKKETGKTWVDMLKSRQYSEPMFQTDGWSKGFVRLKPISPNRFLVWHDIPGSKGVKCNEADLITTLNYMERINT